VNVSPPSPHPTAGAIAIFTSALLSTAALVSFHDRGYQWYVVAIAISTFVICPVVLAAGGLRRRDTADTPGANADEKAANYVGQILARVEAAFPTQFFAERLGTSPVGTFRNIATFLKAQPYDLKTTYPALFFKKNPAAAQALKPEERKQLEAFQRVHRLTGSAEETIALSAKGMDSAQQISRIAREVFAKDARRQPLGCVSDFEQDAVPVGSINLRGSVTCSHDDALLCVEGKKALTRLLPVRVARMVACSSAERPRNVCR